MTLHIVRRYIKTFSKFSIIKLIKQWYNLQISQHNVCYTFIIIIKEIIILKNIKKKKKLLESIVDIIAPMKVIYVLSLINFA